MRRLSDGVRTGAEASERAAGHLRSASQDLVAAVAPIRANSERLEVAMGQLTQSTQNAASTVIHSAQATAQSAAQILAAAQEVLGGHAKAIEASLGGVSTMLNRLTGQGDRLDDLDEKLGKAFDAYTSRVATAVDGLFGHVRKMQDELAPALDTMRAIVDQAEQFAPESRRVAVRAVLQRRPEEEEELAFVSMTDMTVSFLFIVMILLAFFASQFHDPDKVARADFERVKQERNELEAQLYDFRSLVNSLQRHVKDQAEIIGRSNVRIHELEEELNRTQIEVATFAGCRDLAAPVQDQAEIIRQRELRIHELEEELKRLSPEQPIETYLAKVAEQRREVLEALQSKLKVDFPDLQVVVSEEMDALRFKGDGLFTFGSSELRPDKRRIVEVIAARLNEVLPCYTVGRLSSWRDGCNEAGAAIEAVQIEGHTDSDGQDNSNVALSTNRANETFFAMTKREPTLVEHLNNRGQPVLSVAGYGKMRPVADNRTIDGKATNRRIDLRIIMYTPRSLDEIEKIKEDLRNGLAAGVAR